MPNLCQKTTERISHILALTEEFDQLKTDSSNVERLKGIKKSIRDEGNYALAIYQEFLWPTEKFPRIKMFIGEETFHELEQKMLDSNVASNELVESMVAGLFKKTNQKIEVEAVIVSLGKMGFPEKASLYEIYKKAEKMGLQLCSMEVAINLAITMKYEGSGKRVMIAIPPAEDDVILSITDEAPGKYLGSSSPFLYQYSDLFAFRLKKFKGYC